MPSDNVNGNGGGTNANNFLRSNGTGLGLGGGATSIIAILLAFNGGMLGPTENIEDTIQAEEIRELENIVNEHLISTSPHNTITLQLDQINEKLNDIDKLDDDITDLKLILCSNQEFNCRVDLNN